MLKKTAGPVILALLTIACIVFFQANRSSVEQREAQVIGNDPSLRANLCLLDINTSGWTIDTWNQDSLILTTEEFIVNARAIDAKAFDNFLSANRQHRFRGQPVNRETQLGGQPGDPQVIRFDRHAENVNAIQAEYFVSHGSQHFIVTPLSRRLDAFELAPFDELVKTIRIRADLNPRANVLPAWKAYLARPREEGPWAKFDLYMDPAPILLGTPGGVDRAIRDFEPKSFTSQGRQRSAEAVEFCVKDDHPSIRVDVWLNREPPNDDTREPVFQGKLQLHGQVISLASLDQEFTFDVPQGSYEVVVSVIQRRKYSDLLLTERERISRDDLERYEIVLTSVGALHP